jgi:hypothetical protein
MDRQDRAGLAPAERDAHAVQELSRHRAMRGEVCLEDRGGAAAGEGKLAGRGRIRAGARSLLGAVRAEGMAGQGCPAPKMATPAGCGWR